MWSGLVTFTASPGSLRGATLLPRRVITRRQGLGEVILGLSPQNPSSRAILRMDQSMKKSDWLVGATSPVPLRCPRHPRTPPSRPPSSTALLCAHVEVVGGLDLVVRPEAL